MKRISFLILSFAVFAFIFTSLFFSRMGNFGFPYAVYYPPIDCGFNMDPQFVCEGEIRWKYIFIDSIIWLALSFLLYKAYINRNTVLVKVKVKYIVFAIVISIILGLFSYTQLFKAKDYFNQNLECGGIRGKVCPIGFYCPDGKYPDQLRACLSVVELLKRR